MPQDSIHGPILFAIYTDILGISCCFMALNNIYIPKALKFISLARPLQLSSRYISNCIPSIATSIANRHFKHNMSKTECVAFPQRLFLPISVNGTSVHPVILATNLEVVLDLPHIQSIPIRKPPKHIFIHLLNNSFTTLVQPLSSFTWTIIRVLIILPASILAPQQQAILHVAARMIL